MGMFDYVDIKIKCPNCQEEMSGFQSKDGECYLKSLNFSDVDNFYSSCKKCDAWIEINRQRPLVPESAYEVSFHVGESGYTQAGTLDKFIIQETK